VTSEDEEDVGLFDGYAKTDPLKQTNVFFGGEIF
jgi:hypothetical protein